jgi:predicted transglutaminase-like cysteine proteinase
MAKTLLPRSLALLTATAAVTTMLPSAAAAQSLPVTSAASLSWAKTDAILGGAPSALQAVLAQQKGLAAPARPALQPASYSAPPVARAILREEPQAAPGVLSGRPDVFGSVALPVGNTRLSARWHRVEHAALGGAAGRYSQSLRSIDEVGRLEAVNRYVNRRVRFVDDDRQYGRADVWASAAETLTRGRGDCEDYAIAKYQMLRRAGVASRDLYLVIVRDLVTRADHAVLVVRTANRMFVLDNGTDRLLDSESIRDYRPILTFAETGTWTHGYRVHSAPVTMASAEQPARSPVAPAEGQRSWSASLLAFNTGFNK